jgi:hypothetical protein
LFFNFANWEGPRKPGGAENEWDTSASGQYYVNHPRDNKNTAGKTQALLLTLVRALV